MFFFVVACLVSTMIRDSWQNILLIPTIFPVDGDPRYLAQMHTARKAFKTRMTSRSFIRRLLTVFMKWSTLGQIDDDHRVLCSAVHDWFTLMTILFEHDPAEFR